MFILLLMDYCDILYVMTMGCLESRQVTLKKDKIAFFFLHLCPFLQGKVPKL
jgi:hypothetical protein